MGSSHLATTQVGSFTLRQQDQPLLRPHNTSAQLCVLLSACGLTAAPAARSCAYLQGQVLTCHEGCSFMPQHK